VSLPHHQVAALLSPSLSELSATTLSSDEEGSPTLLSNSVCEDNRGGACTAGPVEMINPAPSALEGNAVVIKENEEDTDPTHSAPGIVAVGSASRDGGLTHAIGEPLSSLEDSSVGMIWTLVVALLMSLSTSCFFFSRHTFEKVNLSFISISPLHLTEKQDQLISRLSIAENKLAMGLKVSIN
jgi:hypothetical protein